MPTKQQDIYEDHPKGPRLIDRRVVTRGMVELWGKLWPVVYEPGLAGYLLPPGIGRSKGMRGPSARKPTRGPKRKPLGLPEHEPWLDLEP